MDDHYVDAEITEWEDAMNRINTIRLFAAAIVLAVGIGSAARELKPQVLSKAWVSKMDKDQDGKVATAEVAR